MDRVSILRLITELRRRHGELEDVEAKAAHTGTPADLFKPFLPSPTGQAEESCSSAWTRTPASRSWAWQSPQATEGTQRPGNPDGAASTSQSTRNRLLMQLMEDVHLVENRGCGIDAMLDDMQSRRGGLPAPVFEDRRTSFLVKSIKEPLLRCRLQMNSRESSPT